MGRLFYLLSDILEGKNATLGILAWFAVRPVKMIAAFALSRLVLSAEMCFFCVTQAP